MKKINLNSLIEDTVLNLLYLSYKKDERGEISIDTLNTLLPSTTYFFSSLKADDKTKARSVKKGLVKYDEDKKVLVITQVGIDYVEKSYRKKRRHKLFFYKKYNRFSRM